jgi:pimeloyl-ACP methyl ester carboxylesterase
MKTQTFKRSYFGLAIVSAILLSLSFKASAHKSASSATEEKPTIVLVHGAFADGSSWNKVIPILEKKGYKVIAVQNPLTSLNDDVAFVNRALSEVKGKVVLVGHSWAGVVITEAGNDDKVQALVYVAAYAPNEGQSVNDLNAIAKSENMPDPPALAAPIITDGFIRLPEEAVVHHFAQDLPEQEARLIAVGQGRFNVSCLAAKVTNPAWKNKPSFFVVSDNDQVIQTQLEAEMAKNIGATTIHLPSSHVAMLAKPEQVAALIIKAAQVK